MFLEGVAFVPLGGLASPDLLVSAIATALGFSFHGPTDPGVQLLNYLRRKELLLVLDSFEHLLEGAHLLGEILSQAPGVKLLVTSRQRLNLQAECLLEVPGLRVPADAETERGEEYSAVALFLQSARRVEREFACSGAEMDGVVGICRLVEGMPLGILLAAAWARVLTPAEIAAEIEHSGEFLQAELRDLPERQRSLRAVFDHSYRLLDPPEQAVLRGFSVFRGGFTREGAGEVVGASLRTLRALVDKSLVQRDAAGRYAMHELLRQYGGGRLSEALGEEEQSRDRHCAFYAQFLQARESPLEGTDQRQALDQIAAEIENVRVAWDWALDRDRIEEIDRSLGSLAEFYRIRALFAEGEEAFAGAVRALTERKGQCACPPELKHKRNLAACRRGNRDLLSVDQVQITS
jgi:predicted ATPase